MGTGDARSTDTSFGMTKMTLVNSDASIPFSQRLYDNCCVFARVPL